MLTPLLGLYSASGNPVPGLGGSGKKSNILSVVWHGYITFYLMQINDVPLKAIYKVENNWTCVSDKVF